MRRIAALIPVVFAPLFAQGQASIDGRGFHLNTKAFAVAVPHGVLIFAAIFDVLGDHFGFAGLIVKFVDHNISYDGCPVGY